MTQLPIIIQLEEQDYEAYQASREEEIEYCEICGDQLTDDDEHPTMCNTCMDIIMTWDLIMT